MQFYPFALMNDMHSMHSLLYLSLGAGAFTLLVLFVVAMRVQRRCCNPAWRERLPDYNMLLLAEKLVRVSVTPQFNFSFALMRPGAFQHLDRQYTYDVIPSELLDGLLFQGIHRPPKGTVLKVELLSPATIYFLYHKWGDGGFPAFLNEHQEWQQCPVAPQYDIHNGDHGLKMVMYQREAAPGIYTFPATTADNACFNLVFQVKDEELRTALVGSSPVSPS